MERVEFVGFRAGRDEVAMLDRLADATQRSRSAILRLLVRQARLTGEPDITLREPGNSKQDRVEVRQ